MTVQTQTRTQVATAEFAAALAKGDRLSQDLVGRVMTESFDGGAATGKWTWKKATDLIEAGVIQLLLTKKYHSLADYSSLQELIPHHQVRSEEGIQLQQFSTPLELAWTIGSLTGVTAQDTILEPSCGLGILAATTLGHLTRNPKRLILNEISVWRNGLVQELFPQHRPIYSVDGEYINDTIPRTEQPTLEVMNPPFTSSINRSKRNPDACLRHLRSALLRLKPNGRLVGIFPHWLTPEKFAEYFKALPAQLLLSFYVGGDRYRYHGTNMPTRILAFDKIEQTTLPKSIDFEAKLLPNQITEIALSEMPPRQSIGLEQPSYKEPPLNLFGNLPIFQWISTGGNTLDIDLPLFRHPPTIAKIEQPIESKVSIQLGRFTDCIRLEYRKIENRKVEVSDEIYTPYHASAIAIDGTIPHPSPLAESVTMATIAMPFPTARPLLPRDILSYASHAQLEALVYTCDAHERLLDTKWVENNYGGISIAMPEDPEGKFHRQGILIGDGTGLGKGVEIGLIILTNWCEGRKKTIWLSKGSKLISDARRDWQNLGGSPEQIVPLSAYKLGEKIQLAEGILFASYDSLKTPAKGTKKSRLDQICEWVGPDWDGVLALDECHILGNCVSEKKKRGLTKTANRAIAGTNLVDRLYNARVVYLSATGAAKVNGLAFLQRLGIWCTDAFGFKSRHEFLAKIEDAGLAGLEIVAKDLKRLGLMLSRTLSFEGVKFETLVHELTPQQQQIWDTYAAAFQLIHQRLYAALDATNIVHKERTTNGNSKSLAISQFESTKQRFFEALLSSLKAQTLISLIESDLASGHSAVVQIVSTGAAMLDRRLSKLDPDEYDDIRSRDFSLLNGIISYLEASFPIDLHILSQGDNDVLRSTVARDANDEAIICQEALEIRDRLIEQISMLPPIQGLLDQLIWHFSTEEVAEVTGRSKRIIYQDKKYQLAARSGNSSVAEAIDFQAGKKRILVFSKSGATGTSFHADLKATNQQLRRHYVVQTGFEVLSACQGMGRTHRNNEKQQPEIILLTTNIDGEQRFTSTIASRLSSLGAVTKGQRNTGSQGLFSDLTDFNSQYADTAIYQFFHRLKDNGIDDISLKQFNKLTGLHLEPKGFDASIPETHTLLNRLLALEIDTQNILFGYLKKRIDENIEIARTNGTLDLGVETLVSNQGFEITNMMNIAVHASGGRTDCYEIDRLEPIYLTSVRSAQEIAQSDKAQCYQHKDNGSLAVAIETDSSVELDGTIVRYLSVYRPDSIYARPDQIKDKYFEPNWEAVESTDKYWAQWQQSIDFAPDFKRERFYMVCGLLLPLWNQLPAFTKTYRLQATDGRVLLGRAIERGNIGDLYAKFNVFKNQKLTAEEIHDTVWNHGKTVSLKSWVLQRNKYKGENRIEVIEIYGEDLIDWFKSKGCYTERLEYRTKVFIPSDGIETIERIMTA
jgi:P-loop containing NTP hydrolase pore-1/C-terminal domain on Strawberry notch homologue